MKILLVTPPMTQLNTPYPATAYLTGFLREHQDRLGLSLAQADLAIELFLRLFSSDGIATIAEELAARLDDTDEDPPPSIAHFLEHAQTYVDTVDRVIAFLQGKDPNLAHRIVTRQLLPEGPRFAAIADARPGMLSRGVPGDARSRARGDADVDARLRGARADADADARSRGAGAHSAARAEGDVRSRGARGDVDVDARTRTDGEDADADALAWAFGKLGLADRAKHLASLYVDDLADVIREGIHPEFELARYGERLAASAPTFDPLHEALEGEPSIVDDLLDELARDLVAKHAPDVVGLTAPFPGNVYGAFRIARALKAVASTTRLVLGGGYVNTELRELVEPRVFDYFDFVTLDDGEAPILALLEHLRDSAKPLHRTFVRCDGKVALVSNANATDISIRDTGTPSYEGLPLDRYVSLVEMLNPMNRLWSDGRWNKLTVAHGCYWKQCTFCDVSLDYIARYDRAPADVLVDRIERMIEETGQSGFHFVDEAAPPAALRALAEKLIERGTTITWWGNVRFENAFTPELAELLARSGCVAISGGLEVASDRLLSLMKKGVTVEQVARVTRAFTDAGVMVHAYLMYGFPTQTVQDTIDALEYVRQLFAAGCVQSAFWHRFTATTHSPVGRSPDLFGISLKRPPAITFAKNDVEFVDSTGVDHDRFADGLRKAVYNFMHGLGLDDDPRTWFGRTKLPRPTVPRDFIERALTTS